MVERLWVKVARFCRVQREIVKMCHNNYNICWVMPSSSVIIMFEPEAPHTENLLG